MPIALHLRIPRLVIACAAHSAGGWSSPGNAARAVPFLVTCGEEDRTRIDGAKKFADQLIARRCRVETKWFPGVGHSMCAEARELSEALFWKATTGMTLEERRRAEDALNRGGDLVIAGKYREAVSIFRKIAAVKPTSVFTSRAEAGLKQIDAIGRQKLAEVQKLADADVRKAIPALLELNRQFKGTAAAPDIRRFTDKFRRRPDAAAEFKRLNDAEDAEDLYRRAEKLLEEKKPRRAIAMLTKAARFTETEYGRKAADKLKELGSEPVAKPEPAKETSKKDCARWLQLARNYLAANRPDAARPLLEKIIKTRPDTPEAAEAKRILENL